MPNGCGGSTGPFRDIALEVYLLPAVHWQDSLALQHRLVYEIGEHPRKRAALLLCEHPAILTIGRQGSRRHVLLDEDQLRFRGLERAWTNRGGGAWIQTPGQLAAYPVLPLDPDGFGLPQFRQSIYETLVDVLGDFDIQAEWDRAGSGVHVGDREIGTVGIAVKDWVTYHGCTLNVCPAPWTFEAVMPNPWRQRRPTCMFRERRSPVRPTAVRESFARRFTRRLGFREYFLCAPPRVPTPRRATDVISTPNR